MDTLASPVTEWRVDPARSHVAFVARHMAVASIRGDFRRWEASVHMEEDWACSSIRASVETESIDTTNGERDGHLRKLFDVRRHPKATFESRSVRMVDGTLEVDGVLTLHGVTHDVSFSVDVAAQDDRMCFDAKTTISRKDFGLQWSAILEWTGGVGDRIDLAIHLEMARADVSAW